MATKTVKPSGGDYTSLSAWEAGEQGNLTGAGPAVAECYAMQDTTAVTIDGWTTTATDYIRIYTPSAERHNGAWDTGAYRLEVASVALDIREDYVRLEGLQIRRSSGADFSGPVSINTQNASNAILIESCIVRAANTNAEYGIYSDTANTNMTVRNCIVYDTGAAGWYGAAIWGNKGTWTIDNCTLISGYRALHTDTGTLAARNCYFSAPTTFQGTIGTVTTCAHSSSETITGSTASIAHTTSNFVNVTAGSQDYHLVSGASATLKTGGTDLSGTFTTDIDGETRSDWGIGADEYVAAAAGNPWYAYAQMG